MFAGGEGLADVVGLDCDGETGEVDVSMLVDMYVG